MKFVQTLRNIWKIEDLKPVSYTHLDVYKRQALESDPDRRESEVIILQICRVIYYDTTRV